MQEAGRDRRDALQYSGNWFHSTICFTIPFQSPSRILAVGFLPKHKV